MEETSGSAVSNNSFTMDFGDEIFVAAPIAGQEVTLYKFVPQQAHSCLQVQFNTTMYSFEQAGG